MEYTNHLDKLPREIWFYIVDILESNWKWNENENIKRIYENKMYQYTLSCIDKFNVFKKKQGNRVGNKVLYSHFIHSNKPIVRFMYRKYNSEFRL